MTDAEEEYRGPGTVRIGDEDRAVTVRLSAYFEPIEGRYRWAGRTGPYPVLVDRVRSGVREVVLVIAGGAAAAARIGDPDPYGGVRLSGTGRPPWAGVTAPPDPAAGPAA